VRGFKLEQIELGHRAVGAASPPLTFAHLSDLHLRRWGRRHELMVETINACSVDFVFVTGDVITRGAEGLERAGWLLRRLRCRHGVFAVRGNWEVDCAPPLRGFRSIMRDWGTTLLVNESRVVVTRAGRVRVIGVDDLNRGWLDLAASLASSAGDVEFCVLLSHVPLVVRLLPPGHGVGLVLSGHTHGGQVRLPVVWPLLLPRGHAGFVSGFYDLGTVRLYVSRGFGGVGIVPLRLRCPAEVTLVRVLPQPERGR